MRLRPPTRPTTPTRSRISWHSFVAFSATRVTSGGLAWGIQLRQTNPRRQGDLGEAAGIHWLTAAGAGVSIPLFHSPDYDLLADFQGRILKVQVKTSTHRRNGRYRVELATSGGNQSWNRLVKRFDPSRCDFLFVLVDDGRRWFIPANEIEATRGISLGGPGYAGFEVTDNMTVPSEGAL